MDALVLRSDFELNRPADLVRKLRLDLQAMEMDPDNVYFAFNFFATAAHLPEWVAAGTAHRWEHGADRRSIALRSVCESLAAGRVRMRQVPQSADTVVSLEQRRQGGGRRPGTSPQGEGLALELPAADAQVLGEVTGSLQLARQVLAYWEQSIGR